MKQITIILLSVFLITRSLAAAPEQQKEPIPLGFIAPLTGEYANWGERIKKATILALEDTKHKFELNIQDGGNCEPRKAASIA